MKFITVFRAVACSAVLTGAIMSISAAAPPALKTKNDDARAAYRKGHESLNGRRWGEAFEVFREVERLLGRAKEDVDAALYWQAYALDRAGRKREAKAIAERLVRRYPKSTWKDDAKRLSGPAPKIRLTDDEDILMALDALLASSSRKAVPLLKKVLGGDHGKRVKTRALFVLSQIDAKAADEALQRILRGPGDAKLKEGAIQMIAAGGRPESLLRLEAIYESEPSLRRAVIRAWIVGSRKDLLLRTAKGERDPKLRRRAIEALGALSARKELMDLYGALKKADDRRQVLKGLGIAGATAELGEVAKKDPSPDIRLKAIRALGVAGGGRILREIADAAKTVEEKVAAVRTLGMHGGKEAARFIASKYGEPGMRKAVLHALQMCGAAEQFANLYRVETDKKRKRELLRRLIMTDGDLALDLIETGSKEGDR